MADLDMSHTCTWLNPQMAQPVAGLHLFVPVMNLPKQCVIDEWNAEKVPWSNTVFSLKGLCSSKVIPFYHWFELISERERTRQKGASLLWPMQQAAHDTSHEKTCPFEYRQCPLCNCRFMIKTLPRRLMYSVEWKQLNTKLLTCCELTKCRHVNITGRATSGFIGKLVKIHVCQK